jgi:predicted lipoprotein
MRALLAALLLCTPAAAGTPEVIGAHVLPAHAAFAAAADALAAEDSCDPDRLRPAFHAAYDGWMGVSHLRLGPAEEDGRALAVLFWPDPKGSGWKVQKALLGEPAAALTSARMAEQSVAARGLAGLERLLYPAAPLPADPCPLIRATADDLARTAAALAAGWDPFATLLLTAGEPENPRFLAPEEATQALFTQLVTGLEFTADRRIGRPLGSFDAPRPALAEGHASGRPLRNVALALVALRDLARQLAPESPRTQAAFDHALALAGRLDDPAFAAIETPEGWLKLEILQQAVRATRDSAVAEIGPALGVSVGFNAQDGD